MIDNVLVDFFTALIKKHNKEIEEIPETQLKQFIEEWVVVAAQKARQISLTTHPGKFCHPDARITPFIGSGTYEPDGYLRTGNTNVEIDTVCGAAVLPIKKFLDLTLSDGKTVFEHIEQETKYIKELLNFPSLPFSDIRKEFLRIKEDKKIFVTDPKIKQIYFPVGNNKYHLLSIVDPSGISFGLKDRINKTRFDDDSKPVKEAKRNNTYSEHTYSDIYNLTIISFGGSKPQNISFLNNKYGGSVYLFSSLPPEHKIKKMKLPFYDFFSILKTKKFEYLLLELYRIIRSYKNNYETRKKRDEIIEEIINKIIDNLHLLRQVEAGWSRGEKFILLPNHQKICADQLYENERKDTSSWFPLICKDFSENIISCYNKISKDEKTDLGENEHFKYFSTMFEKQKELLI